MLSDLLDLVGLLLVVAGMAVLAAVTVPAVLAWPAALGVAGVGVLGVSWLADRRAP